MLAIVTYIEPNEWGKRYVLHDIAFSDHVAHHL